MSVRFQDFMRKIRVIGSFLNLYYLGNVMM
jgi:hypothetical protein